MERMLDQVSRGMAQATSRRQALKIMGAGVAGVAGSALFARGASAAPLTCLTCACGVGKPCNVKQQVCTAAKQFPDPNAACTTACEQNGFKFCGGVVQTHCPQGCP